MLEYAQCNFVALSSGFAEICQSVLRNYPVTTEECYAYRILFSGQFRKEAGGCMAELQINFTVFTLASFLFSQGLCFLGDWALHSFLSPLHTAHGEQMLAVCVPGWDWYHYAPCTVLTDVAPFQEDSWTSTPVARTTCFWRPADSCSFQSVELMGCSEFALCVKGLAIPHSKYGFDKYMGNSSMH